MAESGIQFAGKFGTKVLKPSESSRVIRGPISIIWCKDVSGTGGDRAGSVEDGGEMRAASARGGPGGKVPA